MKRGCCAPWLSLHAVVLIIEKNIKIRVFEYALSFKIHSAKSLCPDKVVSDGWFNFFKNDLIVVINLLLTLDSGSFNLLENEEISCLAKYFITDNKADSIKIGLY